MACLCITPAQNKNRRFQRQASGLQNVSTARNRCPHHLNHALCVLPHCDTARGHALSVALRSCLNIEPVFIPLTRIVDDVIFDGPILLIVANNTIMKAILPIEFRPSIFVAPFGGGALNAVDNGRNRTGNRSLKPVFHPRPVVCGNDDQGVKMIRHDDEFVQQDRRINYGDVLQTQRHIVADFAQSANAVSDGSKQTIKMLHANGNEIGIGG